MPSKNHIQELQFSRFSESRKKLDSFRRIENGNAQDMENAAAGMVLQYNKSQRDSRNSLAWDNAFFTSPGILEPEELFGTLNFQEMEHRVEMPRMVASDTFEQEETSRDSKFNSRRSLAWDSAFYTSAGVLDPEELSIVNGGFKEFGTDLHPGVGVKNWRSVKSNSKINGDGHCLARLENDLFDDLKASNAAISTSRQGRGNNLQNTLSLKVSDASSQVRMKSTPASSRQNMNMNKSERNGKDASLPPRAQSKILDRRNSPTRVVTKRASSCSKHMKLENNDTKAASVQYMSVTKRPCLGNSSSVIPKSAASLKSPSSGSHATRNVAARRSCGLSKSAGKSPLKFQEGKFDSRLAASCSFSPSRYSPGNENGLLFSSLKSSESSASINQTFENSMESLDSTPSRDMSFDVDASQASKSESRLHGHHSFRRENQDARFQDRHVNKFSTGNSPVPTDISTHSGLRMPSPKIGFFDTENTVALTQKGKRNGAANGTTPSKLQLIRDTLRTSNPKLVSPLGIRNSHPGMMQKRKSMKREPLHILKAKKQTLKENENSSTHSCEKITPRLNEDDKENSYNNHNQVDSLSKHIEAIDLNGDIMTELNKEKIVP